MNQPTQNILRTIGILLAAAVCLSLPIFYFGMPGGNDLPQHYRFVIAFYDALRSGDIYPVWISDTNLGFGDAGVRFYPPVGYYVVAFFRFFVPSWNAALASAVCFWFFVGSSGVYLLSREWFSERASLAAALVFMIMPYHVNQVYNAGLFAEFGGLAILPFCFLFVKRIASGGGAREVVGLAVSYALLILSHLPLSIVGSAALLVFSLTLMTRAESNLAMIGKLVMSVGIAAAASAFYWVRMVSELSFVKHSLSQFTEQSYDFRLNFLASFLYVPAEQYRETSLWFSDLWFVMTLAMILPSLAIYLKLASTFDRRKIIPIVAVLIFAIVLGTPVSSFLWEHIGPLQKTQFPWRLLGLVSLAGSLLVAGFAEQCPAIFKGNMRPFGIIAVGLILAGFVFTFAQVIRPAVYPELRSFETGFERYRTDESYECWWPVWASRDAFNSRDRVSGTSRPIDVVTWKGTEREIYIGEGASARIRVASFYYPFWKATDGHALIDVEPAPDGAIFVTVPAGPRNVRLFFESPAYETYSRIISMVAWLALLLVLVADQTRRLSVSKFAWK